MLSQLFANLLQGQALRVAQMRFPNSRVLMNLRGIEADLARDDLRGFDRAAEIARDEPVEAFVFQLFTQLASLSAPLFVQGNIEVALKSPFGVPIRFSMSEQKQRLLHRNA